ncbi:hypothetical protein ABW19_dt0210502 [Dactylella cylindrospora]|nr:hypothetical protein ABW19_dt0210502 [Dactylella cylindrospora]
MAFGWDEARDSYSEVHHNNESSLSHELIAGAAAFAGFHEFEKRQRKEGKTVNHGFAKELLAAAAAAEADKLIETKGRDKWDEYRAKEEAKKKSEELYDQHYGGYDKYDPENQRPHEHIREHHHHHHNEEW